MPNLLDNPSSKEDVSTVEHRHLSRGDHLHRFVKVDFRVAVYSPHSARSGVMLVADLNKGFLGEVLKEPVAGRGQKPKTQKVFPPPHDDFVPLRMYGNDVERVRCPYPESFPLPNGVVENASMLPKNPSISRNDIPGFFLSQVPGEEFPVVPSRDEAEVLALGLFRHRKASPFGNCAYLFFRVVPKGKEKIRESLLWGSGEKVRLVLSAVLRAPDDIPAVLLLFTSIMPGGEKIAP